MPQKNGSPPPRLLQKLFQLLSSWGQCQLETLPHMLSSAKQEKIMVIVFLIASSSTTIYAITPLLVFQAIYGRGKALTTRQHEGFANYPASEAILHNGGFAECRGFQFPLGHRAPIIPRLITVVSKTVYPSPGTVASTKSLIKSWSPCPLSLALVCLISCLHISNPRWYFINQVLTCGCVWKGPCSLPHASTTKYEKSDHSKALSIDLAIKQGLGWIIILKHCSGIRSGNI